MHYSAKYFKDNLPGWKNNKSSIIVRIFYRPVSFYLSSFAAKCKLSANTISYFSAVIAVLACGLYLINNHAAHIIGAVLINLWLILDCVDGNIARCVKQQPFGEFADAVSSYLLVGLICTTISASVYWTGGIFVEPGQVWIILIGAFASSSDSLMRLIYQKYRSTAKALQDLSIILDEKDVRDDPNLVGSIQIRIEKELGIAGILPLAILIATLFNALDLVVFYCFLYYGSAFVVSTLLLIRKTVKRTYICED